MKSNTQIEILTDEQKLLLSYVRTGRLDLVYLLNSADFQFNMEILAANGFITLCPVDGGFEYQALEA